MPLTDGENVGAYRIVEKLGQGGMATVYKAYHPALDRYVAVKVLHPAFTEDPTFLARFQREARIVAKLDHPNIVPIYDFAEHHGHTYLVMRFIDGETLKARMKRGGVTIEEVLRIAGAVGNALTYAHKQGVLHRDIKPSNIMLTPDGGVFLTDFGLARMAAAGESTMSRDMMVGTPQYISPEQAKGSRDLSACTDVYSLGVVLYELLVGRVPYTADTPYAIIHDHIFTPLPLPRHLNPDIPEGVERVLLRSLAKEPKDRYQSVGELVTALDKAVRVSPMTPRPLPADTLAADKKRPPDVAPEPRKEAAKRKKKARKVKPPRRAVSTPPPRRRSRPRKKGSPWPWVAAIAALVVVCVLSLVCYQGVNQQREIDAKLAEAQQAWEEGRNLDALEIYRDTAEDHPRAIDVYLQATELLAMMGRYEEALSFVGQGLEARPNSAELHQRAAELAALGRKWDAAEAEIGWLLENDPENAAAHAYAALLILGRDRDCEQAKGELEVALELDPGQKWAHYGQAVCYAEDGDADRAARVLDDLLREADLPPVLHRAAEAMLENLEGGTWAAIEREFDALRELAEVIPNPALRDGLLRILDEAESAWHEGDRARSRVEVQHARDWLDDKWDGVNAPLNEQIAERLDMILTLSAPPGEAP
jgi:serine/threonine protein kinase/tetratricopeptide (TPR) repeat protein